MTELPVFAGKLVTRMGARRVLDASAAAYVFRLLGYTLLGPTAGEFVFSFFPLFSSFLSEKKKKYTHKKLMSISTNRNEKKSGPAAILPLEALHGIAFAGELKKEEKPGT